MACDRDNTIGSPPSSSFTAGRDLLASLPSAERDAVIKETRVINQPSCWGQHSGPCSTDQERLEAWKNLVRSSPYAGFRLLSKNTDTYPWPNVHYFTRTSEDQKIPDEVWKQVLALEWVLENLGREQKMSFIETLMSRGEVHPWILLNMSAPVFVNPTAQETETLENLRNELLRKNRVTDSEVVLLRSVKKAFTHRVLLFSPFEARDVVE